MGILCSAALDEAHPGFKFMNAEFKKRFAEITNINLYGGQVPWQDANELEKIQNQM